jgi:predicted transcriptional regulator
MLDQIDINELEEILLDLESSGLVERIINSDGEPMYKITKKGFFLYKTLEERNRSTVH